MQSDFFFYVCSQKNQKGTMNDKFLIISALIIICFFSCRKNDRREEASRIVREWTGKEIKFPENVSCFVLGKDTLTEVCKECYQKDLKILLYIDSTGCSSCRLQLFEWKQLIEETDSLFQGSVGFLLFFQPKNVKDVIPLFVRDRFKYPINMDLNGMIDRFNQFPEKMQYQCFLLDKDNRVLAIGNPVTNPAVWKLYKKIITERNLNLQSFN